MSLRISLVGLPGSGKSVAARYLARRVQLPFHDSDHEIELRIGGTIRDYFEREGEDRFRALEEEVLDELSLQPGVLATGGGAVLRAINRVRLRERGHVIYLKATPQELMRRLRHDTRRPLLQVADPLQKLRELYEVRDPLYRETAHFVLETGRPSMTRLSNMIVMQLELAGIISPV